MTFETTFRVRVGHFQHTSNKACHTFRVRARVKHLRLGLALGTCRVRVKHLGLGLGLSIFHSDG